MSTDFVTPLETALPLQQSGSVDDQRQHQQIAVLRLARQQGENIVFPRRRSRKGERLKDRRQHRTGSASAFLSKRCEHPHLVIGEYRIREDQKHDQAITGRSFSVSLPQPVRQEAKGSAVPPYPFSESWESRRRSFYSLQSLFETFERPHHSGIM